ALAAPSGGITSSAVWSRPPRRSRPDPESVTLLGAAACRGARRSAAHEHRVDTGTVGHRRQLLGGQEEVRPGLLGRRLQEFRLHFRESRTLPESQGTDAAQVRVDAARGDAVDLDCRPQFVRQLADHADHCVLGRRVDHAAATWVEPRERSSEDHSAFRLLQFRYRGLGAQDVDNEVDCEEVLAGPLQRVLVDLVARAEAVEDAGVTDEDVELAECLYGFADRALVVCHLPHVTNDRQQHLAEVLLELRGSLWYALQHRHAGAFADELLDNGPANAGAPTSEQDSLIVQ